MTRKAGRDKVGAGEGKRSLFVVAFQAVGGRRPACIPVAIVAHDATGRVGEGAVVEGICMARDARIRLGLREGRPERSGCVRDLDVVGIRCG